MLLTTSYKKIGSKSMGGGDELRLYGKYTSQSTTSNTTTVYFKLEYYRKENWMSSQNVKTKLDGTSKSHGTVRFNAGNTFLQEVKRTISHRNDGTSPTRNVSGSITKSYGGNGTASASVTVPTIKRRATVTSATNFTDETTPTLTFDNPAGFTTKPYLNFYDKAGNRKFQLLRGEATSPYTWEFTAEELEQIRQATNQQKEYEVTVGVDTYSASTFIGDHSLSRKMTYVNANPTFTDILTETDNSVIPILGATAENWVQNKSKIKVDVTPTTLKYATVKAIYVNYGGLYAITNEPYTKTIDIKDLNVISIYVEDSRGFTSEVKNITKNLIAYSPMEITNFEFKRENPTSSNLILNAQIKYTQTNFGTTANVPTVKYKRGTNGTEIAITDYTIQDGKININNLTLNDVIPYTEEDRIYLYVNDLLSSDTENEIVLRGIPTFDYGQYDLQVNGDLKIADTNRENVINVRPLLPKNKLIWSGAWYMNENQKIEFSEDDYSLGVSLVFTPYNETTGYENWGWTSFFVSKVDLQQSEGWGHIFNLQAVDQNHKACKYLYMSSTKIEGNQYNGTNGQHGESKYWALHLVIGI